MAASRLRASTAAGEREPKGASGCSQPTADTLGRMLAPSRPPLRNCLSITHDCLSSSHTPDFWHDLSALVISLPSYEGRAQPDMPQLDTPLIMTWS